MAFQGSGWVFMVSHDYRLVFHGSWSVFMVFHGSRLVFHVFFSKMYPPELCLGPTKQSRSAAQRAA